MCSHGRNFAAQDRRREETPYQADCFHEMKVVSLVRDPLMGEYNPDRSFLYASPIVVSHILA